LSNQVHACIARAVKIYFGMGTGATFLARPWQSVWGAVELLRSPLRSMLRAPYDHL